MWWALWYHHATVYTLRHCTHHVHHCLYLMHALRVPPLCTYGTLCTVRWGRPKFPAGWKNGVCYDLCMDNSDKGFTEVRDRL